MGQERCGIIELFKTDGTHAEIMKLLNFPESRQKFVHRTIRRYKETGGAADRARSSRPPSIRVLNSRRLCVSGFVEFPAFAEKNDSRTQSFRVFNPQSCENMFRHARLQKKEDSFGFISLVSRLKRRDY